VRCALQASRTAGGMPPVVSTSARPEGEGNDGCVCHVAAPTLAFFTPGNILSLTQPISPGVCVFA
jgi:hypothetical protein